MERRHIDVPDVRKTLDARVSQAKLWTTRSNDHTLIYIARIVVESDATYGADKLELLQET